MWRLRELALIAFNCIVVNYVITVINSFICEKEVENTLLFLCRYSNKNVLPRSFDTT